MNEMLLKYRLQNFCFKTYSHSSSTQQYPLHSMSPLQLVKHISGDILDPNLVIIVPADALSSSTLWNKAINSHNFDMKVFGR